MITSETFLKWLKNITQRYPKNSGFTETINDETSHEDKMKNEGKTKEREELQKIIRILVFCE